MPVCLRQEIKSQKAFKSNKNRESRLLYQKVMIIVAVVFSERFIEITTYIKFGKKKVCTLIGPWWWSSGQRAHLQLRRSEFESR